MATTPELVVVVAHVTGGVVTVPAGAVVDLEGESVYLIGPAASLEVLELMKRQHTLELHLNPTWEGEVPPDLQPTPPR
jgi:hypothetical protein